MSYPIIDDSQFDFKQKQIIAQARIENGIHIIENSGSRMCAKVGTQVKHMTRFYPVAMTEGVRMTMAVFYPIKGDMVRIMMQDPSNRYMGVEFSLESPIYMVFVFPGTLPDRKDHYYNHFPPYLHVLRIECIADDEVWVYVDDKPKIHHGKVKVTSMRKLTMEDTTSDPAECPYLLEVHLTCPTSEKIFNHQAAMSKPTSTLSPGGYVIWEGDASGVIEIKYNNVTIFNENMNKKGVRLIMKVYETKLEIGHDDGRPLLEKDNPKANVTGNPIYDLTISQAMKMTNFILHTGVSATRYF
ncbi:uncharacterized protein LOC135370028 [Ornithodoros turicata]|uniref:uncharacterized protein LOC135370028 n=1 Tax=Ornithodoros turicata TaxID=34597 RepID=UPI00313993A7